MANIPASDNHNAEPFAQCYRRLADLVPQPSRRLQSTNDAGFSGNLLWGVGQMGRSDSAVP